MKIRALTELANPKQWKNLPISKLKETGFPVYGANGIIGFYGEYNHRHPTIAITCRGATCGNIHITLENSYITSNAMALDDLDLEQCDLKYLAQYLRFRGLSDVTTGAAQPQITRANLEKVNIPLPEIRVQVHIAHLLGKVEGLIAQRKQHLQQLDDLLKSVFLDMFGDPVRNDKGWEKKRISALVVDIESGKSPKCESRPAFDDEWGVLKLGAVTKCVFAESENKALPKDVSPVLRHEVKAGDILFSRKNTHALVAACAYVFNTRPKLLMPDLIFRLVLREDARVHPIYMWKLLISESQRKSIQSLAAGAAGSMPNISKANLREVQLPIPPLPLQDKFVDIVEKVENLKSDYQQSLDDLESLYGVLSQKAFKGELDLSRVPLLDIQPQESDSVTEGFIADDDDSNVFLNTDNQPDPSGSSELRRSLITQWLEAYRTQLGSDLFSVGKFVTKAQSQLATQNSETDFELGTDDYETIKSWVFDALAAGRLTQQLDEESNSIELNAVKA